LGENVRNNEEGRRHCPALHQSVAVGGINKVIIYGCQEVSTAVKQTVQVVLCPSIGSFRPMRLSKIPKGGIAAVNIGQAIDRSRAIPNDTHIP